MEKRKEGHQYYHDHPMCECGQILVLPSEIIDGSCAGCNYGGYDFEEEARK